MAENMLHSQDETCFGAQAAQVDEPRTLFIFELEAYPEAKSLLSPELRALEHILGRLFRQ